MRTALQIRRLALQLKLCSKITKQLFIIRINTVDQYLLTFYIAGANNVLHPALLDHHIFFGRFSITTSVLLKQ